MFNYKIKKLKVWWRKKFNLKPKLKENEEILKNIIIKFLHLPNTTFFMTPNFRYYIQTDNGENTILLGDNYIKLTNHKYVYEVHLSERVSNELISLVKKAIEQSSNKMDKEIFVNEMEMLKQILEK